MTILIPMAGAGSRFAKEGYADSKPLIDVLGLPMIVRIIDNLPASDNYIFIVRQDMHDLDRLSNLINSLKPKSKIIIVDKLTQGAAETCLLAKNLINNKEPLLIANCDQIHNWNINEFELAINQNIDGAIVTFESTSPLHSYAKIEDGAIIQVAEKLVISTHATTGVYFWKKGSDFVNSAENMIKKNIRTNNEYYVCPSYNELIADGKKIISYPIPNNWSIGTPDELRHYIKLNGGVNEKSKTL